MLSSLLDVNFYERICMKMYLPFALAAVILTSASITLCDPKRETPDEYSKVQLLAGTAKGAAALSQGALGLGLTGLACLFVWDLYAGSKDKAIAYGCIGVGVLVAPSCFYAAWKFGKSSLSSFRKAYTLNRIIKRRGE